MFATGFARIREGNGGSGEACLLGTRKRASVGDWTWQRRQMVEWLYCSNLELLSDILNILRTLYISCVSIEAVPRPMPWRALSSFHLSSSHQADVCYAVTANLGPVEPEHLPLWRSDRGDYCRINGAGARSRAVSYYGVPSPGYASVIDQKERLLDSARILFAI